MSSWILLKDSPLDHTWDKERAALEVGRVEVSSRVDGLALELV